MVSAEERAHFTRAGWLRRGGFFGPEAVARIRGAVDALGAAAARRLSGGTGEDFPGLVVVPEREDPAAVCRYEYVLGSHPELRELLLGLLAPAVCELAGEPFIPFKDKVNEKRPGGGAYRAHQDIVAYRAFGPRAYVTAMVTVDPATLENGALFVAESYRIFARANPWDVTETLEGRPVLRSYHGGERHGDLAAEIARRISWRPLETRPDELVLFDSFVPHRSEVNRSASSRRALFVTFAAAREGDWYERYYEEKRRSPLDPKFHVSTPTRHALL